MEELWIIMCIRLNARLDILSNPKPNGKQMFTRFFYFSLVSVVCGLVPAGIYSIDPRATYLLTSQDSAPNAKAFLLAEMSLSPGDFIRLQQFGDYKPGTIYNDASKGLIAVFSGTNILLSSNLLNRVQDALDAGIDVATSVTFYGSLATDIPEDFLINDTYVQIPQGAAYLFIAASDSLYRDNSDPDGDFAVGITRCICPIGDLDSDCTVNYTDFSILASQWMGIPAGLSADIYPQPEGDGLINLQDLLVLAENWLAPIMCE